MDSITAWAAGSKTSTVTAGINPPVESRFDFNGTVAPTDPSRATDAREKGRIGIYGSGYSLMGSSPRVTSETIGRDINPLGRGDGLAYVGGALNFGRLAPMLPGSNARIGWGSSVNNGIPLGESEPCSGCESSCGCCAFAMGQIVTVHPPPLPCDDAVKAVNSLCGNPCNDAACNQAKQNLIKCAKNCGFNMGCPVLEGDIESCDSDDCSGGGCSGSNDSGGGYSGCVSCSAGGWSDPGFNGVVPTRSYLMPGKILSGNDPQPNSPKQQGTKDVRFKDCTSIKNEDVHSQTLTNSALNRTISCIAKYFKKKQSARETENARLAWLCLTGLRYRNWNKIQIGGCCCYDSQTGQPWPDLTNNCCTTQSAITCGEVKGKTYDKTIICPHEFNVSWSQKLENSKNPEYRRDAICNMARILLHECVHGGSLGLIVDSAKDENGELYNPADRTAFNIMSCCKSCKGTDWGNDNDESTGEFPAY